MTYFWFGGAPGARKPDVYLEDPATGDRLANTAVTVRDAATGAILSDFLDSTGQPATQISSDAEGYLTFAATSSYVYVDGGSGTWAFYSDGAVAEAIAALPQLDDIQASAAASAFSAKQAQAAAEAAASGATAPTNTAIDARLGGDSTGLVGKVAGKVDKAAVWLNVMDYGAKADDTTDFAPAWNAASQVGLALGVKRVVLIPAGKYRTFGHLIMRENTTYIAYGATITRGKNMAFVRNIEDNDVDAFNGYGGRSNITLLGGTYDHAGSYNPANDGADTVSFNHCENITVRDVKFLNGAEAHALQLNACRNVLVSHCEFYGFTQPSGTRDFSEAIELDMALASSTSQANFDGTACEDITIENCRFGASSTLGVWGRAIGCHAQQTGVFHKRITIRGNVINGAIRQAIYMMQCQDLSITDNRVINTALAGICVLAGASGGTAQTGLTGTIIANNTVRDTPAAAAIYLAGTTTDRVYGAVVTGNTARNVQRLVEAAYTDHLDVANNQGYDMANIGVYVTQSNYTGVRNNRIVRSVGNGISMESSSTKAQITNNTVSGASAGINLSGCPDSKVMGNFVDSVTTAAIRLTVGSTNCQIVMNTGRVGTGVTAAYSIPSTVTGVWRFGNDFRGMVVTGDASTSPATGTADIIA